MRKVFFVIIGTFICLSINVLSMPVYGYSQTGHEDFRKITFVEEGNLLNCYSKEDIDKRISDLPRKFIGWSTSYMNYEVPITYDGNIIFARSNQSKAAMLVEFSVHEVETTKTSVKVTGSVSAKVTGTIKKINTSVEGKGEIEAQKEDSNSFEKNTKTSINVNIPANMKLILILTGEAYLTNGVSRYTFFGITFSKGSWERIDVDTTYYELREETDKK